MIDKETNLPLVTPKGPKTVLIDNPKLIADLRVLEEARQKSEQAARTVGYQMVLLTGTAAAVGQKAFVDDQKWMVELYKIGQLYGLKPEQIAGTDLDKGVIILR